MSRRKEAKYIDLTDAWNDIIPGTLPIWEERWLHALREDIRRELGYKESKATVSEEEFKRFKRKLAEWKKDAPRLDLQHILRLIDLEIKRRGAGQSDVSGKP